MLAPCEEKEKFLEKGRRKEEKTGRRAHAKMFSLEIDPDASMSKHDASSLCIPYPLVVFQKAAPLVRFAMAIVPSCI